MKIIITAESTIDCPQELLNQYNIKTVPFTIILGEKEYFDGTITNEDVFAFVKQNKVLPKTSAVNYDQYKAFFERVLKEEGADAIIHFSISSGFSSAINNAKEAAKDVGGVYIVNSLSLSTGIALQAIKASEMAASGATVDEILDEMETTVKNTQASFVLDRLDYMYKGGRCSAITLLGANLLSLKPQLSVADGSLRVNKKYLGKLDKVIKKYCADIIAASGEVDTKHAFITYTTATDEMVSVARDALTERGFENIHETRAGCTVSSHCGPYTLGILFIRK